MQAAAAMFTYF